MAKDQNVSAILFKERKIILFATALAIVLSTAVTFFIPKKYASFAIIYPTKTNSLDEIANNPDFGFDIHADRFIQLVGSQIIQDSLVHKFNLLEYYELDKEQNDWRYKLNKFMARDIKTNRTRFLSVVITVTTKDAELSANMANYIVKTVDVVKENILKENTKLAVAIYKEQYERQSSKVDSLLEEVFYLAEGTSDNRRENILFQKRKEIIKEKQKRSYYSGADDVVLKISGKNQNQRAEKTINNYYVEKDILYNINKKYENAMEQAGHPIPKSYVISEARPDHKKVSPSFGRNALMAIGISILSSLLIILIKYKTEEVKENIG